MNAKGASSIDEVTEGVRPRAEPFQPEAESDASARVHGGERLLIAERLGLRPEEILDLSASINPLGPPKGVRHAIQAALQEIDRYPEQEPRRLIKAISKRFEVPERNILVGNGSVELIYLMASTIAPKTAMVVAPDFCEYELALGGSGASIGLFHLDKVSGFTLDFEDPRLLHPELLILSNPNNPTGTLFDSASLRLLAEKRAKLGYLTVIDEAFMDFAPEGSLIKEAATLPNLIVLRSLTKFYALAGLRLGFLIAPDGIMERLRACYWPWSVNTLAAAAGEAALADVDYEAETLRDTARLRESLSSALASFEWLKPHPSAANYIFLELQGGIDSTELTNALTAQGVLVRNCISFHGLGNRFIRVAVRSNEENGRLVEALRTIK